MNQKIKLFDGKSKTLKPTDTPTMSPELSKITNFKMNN
jgi:hypothetical protein